MPTYRVALEVLKSKVLEYEVEAKDEQAAADLAYESFSAGGAADSETEGDWEDAPIVVDVKLLTLAS